MPWGIAAVVATVVGGAITAQNQHNAGVEADYAAQAQAKSEEMAARDQEIQRKQKLITALANQNAQAGATGAASGVGSALAINQKIVADANRDLETNKVISAETAARLRRQGAAARAEGNMAAWGTVFDTVGAAAGGMGGMSKGTGFNGFKATKTSSGFSG